MPVLRPSLLKTEPGGAVHSLDELFSLAHAMEREAAARYAHLADKMRGQGKQDLANVFEELTRAERENDETVVRWSTALLGRTPDPMLVRWEAPETVDAETAAEITTSRLMTPYRAFSMAVRNKEQLFAFWSYVAAYAEDDRIKSAAEKMARAELGHISALRKERRRAYHREHPGPQQRATGDVAPLQIDAAALERRLSQHLAELAARLKGAAASRANELSREALDMSERAHQLGRFPAELAERDAPMIAEALVDSYLEQAETAHDAERLELLQQLAHTSIARLAWLRAQIG